MKLLIVLLMTCMISSCNEDNTAQTTNTEVRKLNGKTESSLLNTQMDAIKKAEELEDSLQQAVDDRELKMRQQGI